MNGTTKAHDFWFATNEDYNHKWSIENDEKYYHVEEKDRPIKVDWSKDTDINAIVVPQITVEQTMVIEKLGEVQTCFVISLALQTRFAI